MKLAPSPVSGFTLSEMLIVLTIVGVLAAIALPSFKSLMQGQRVKNASFEMYALLSFARSEAIKRNQVVTVAPESSWSALESIDVASGTGSTKTLFKSMTAPKGVSLKPSTSVPTTGFSYQRNGRTVEAGPLTFQLDVENSATPTANVRCIRIELSGMPRTIKGTCS